MIFDHPLTRNGDEDVLPLEDLHLLEAPPGDELVDLALAAPVQQHEAVLRPYEEVDAPERGAQDLGVEALLVLPDLGRVLADVVRHRGHVHARHVRHFPA